MLGAACGGDAPTQPGTPDDTTGGGGTIQKARLDLQVQVASEDASAAQQLGWGNGAIPAGIVVLRRLGSNVTDTAMTDSRGSVSFIGLIEGGYQATVFRPLSESEREQLSGGQSGILGFGGARSFSVTVPVTTETLSALGSRPGSLVISEFWDAPILTESMSSYLTAGFLEIYNNSDSTIYLDGKVVGSGFAHSSDAGDFRCSNYLEYLQDPEGIWTRYLFRFPGTGRSYAIRPGTTKVLAVDAIDHREFVSEGRDLSGADFEFLGTSDVDNPAVPNLLPIAPDVDLPSGHGRFHLSINAVLFIADPVDPDTLPQATLQFASGWRVVRVPGSALLDVLSYVWIGGSSPTCKQLVHPRFDAQTVTHSDGRVADSFQRLLLPDIGADHPILQRTRTSARDFDRAPNTPRQIPR